MKKLNLSSFVAAMFLFAASSPSLFAQQLPNSGFEDWGGAAFNGNIQLTSWKASNVEQTYMGITARANMVTRSTDAHSGLYSACVKNTKVEVAGIGEVSPAWITLGTPFADISNDIAGATAGTYGGMNFTYRPDTMQVWIKRTGGTAENYNLVYYSWYGTTYNTQYDSKSKGCVTISQKTDEESDIRQQTDKNRCATPTGDGAQVGEGWVKEMKIYNSWTLIKVPINYYNDSKPTKVNVILSAGNYPNFRANNVLEGYTLYVDDLSLIYSSKIHKLLVNGRAISGFNPNVYNYTYELGVNATDDDVRNVAVTAYRSGRKLSGSEITMTSVNKLGDTMTITVKAEDGSSTTKYYVTFIKKKSTNSAPASIEVGGTSILGFNAYESDYTVEVPYGSTEMPEITITKGESKQTYEVTPCSIPGTAVVTVYAEDTSVKSVYNIHLVNAKLSDTTLEDILINGRSLPGFKPTRTTYNNVEIPIGSTSVAIGYESAYPAGEQTVVIDNQGVNATSTITVTAPGATSPRVYKITCNEAESSYAYLNDLKVGGVSVDGFDSETFSYTVNLPVGTTEIPAITWTAGDAYQTITLDQSGISGVDGTARVIVVAGNGVATQTYRLTFATLKSSVCTLNDILLDGVSLVGFDAETTNYTQNIASGAALPTVTYVKGDEWQSVSVLPSSSRIRLVVTAQDGSSKTYTIDFVSVVSDVTTLNDILLNGVSLAGFDANTLEYNIDLPRGTASLPTVTWVAGDAGQTIRYFASTSLNGQSRIQVKSQAGSVANYLLNFSVPVSSDANLTGISLDGVALEGFDAAQTDYAVVLPSGTVALPEITYIKNDEYQTVKVQTAGVKGTTTLTVTAEDGTKKIYSIAFSVEKSANAALTGIYLDGVLIDGFDPDVLDYTYALDASAVSCPVVTVGKTEGQTVSVIVPARLGTARITVTPEEGASNIYTVTFTEQLSTNSLLADLQVDGTSVLGFQPTIFGYAMELPQGTSTLPLIAYTKGDDKQQVYVQTNGLNGPTVLTVVAENGSQSVYTLQFAVEQSSSALLADILIDGVSLAGFDANTFVYNCTLVDGAACPTITYVKGEAGQVVELSQPALQGLATLHVTSEDGTAEAMYELSFAYATYTERYLTDLQVNGATVIGFDPETLSYDVTLPYGSAIPTIDYTTAAGQSMSMTNDKTGCTLRVTAGDGVVTIYTVNYIYSVSTQSALADLQIYNAETEQYVSLAGFAPEVLNYNQSLAWRSSRVPAINPVFMDDSQSAVIAYSGVSGTTTITVTAGDKVSQTVYTIAFEVAKSSDANLSAIMIGDEEIELQDGETDYVYELPYGTTALPMISYEKGVAADGSVIGEQTVSMTVAPIDKTSSIEVTAEDGSVQTYHLDFVVAAPQKSNTLQYIYCGSAFVAVQEDVYTYNLTFPYGTTVVPDVTYVKQYPEQTVDVVKGTMNQATTLTVHSNVVGVADVIYTLNISAVASPSYSLTGITGATLYPDFDPNVTHYVAMVTDPNQVVFSIDESVSRLEVTRTASVCTAEVFDKDDDFYTRTYTVSLHYPDVIPNGEMTDWTTAKYNKGAKPVSWTVPADVAESKFVGVWGMGVTYYSGQEIQKGDGFAKLSTRVSGKVLGGYFPGMMTLGNMSVSYGEANGTTSSVDGGIPFRNTPDLFSIRYAYPKKNDDRITNLHFKCTLTDGSATVFAEHTDNVVSSNYKVVNVPIEYNNGFAPTTMNILLNSSQTENASAMSDLGSSIGGWFSSGTNDEVAVANVDYVRFIYNSTLASMTVDGNAPTKTSGTNYAYTLDSEYIGLPALDFVGEVSDQGYGISWSDEVSGVRTATIISYAEDASTTTYVLTLNRPASDINTLNKLLVGGVALTGFDANVTEYSVQVPHGTRCLPDVQVEKGSYYQNVALARNGYDATITVIAENGAQKVYIIHFVESKSSNATLQSVSVDGFDINFDAAVNDYAIELEAHTTVLPAISFEKLSDGQTVVLVEGGVNGVTTLTVTAEDGTTTNVYSIASSVAGFDASEAVLADLSVVNGNVLNYQKETYRYTYNRPNGQVLYGAYAGLWSEDVMSAVVTADSLVVSLSNAASTQAHNYTLVFETVASTNALLADILINGVSYGEFNPNLGDYEYPLVAGQMLSVEPIAAEPAQTLSMIYDEATTTYTIDVTAEDGLTTKSYTIAVLADLSNNALLADLQLDGVTVAGFVADQFVYSVELPSVTPKMTQPSLPDLTAVGADRGQTIVVDYNGLDEVSYITVTAEDGVTENTYEITISAQKSSNALLDDLVADYVSLTDFAQDKFDYTLDVQGNYRPTISWQSGDAFQEITDDITADRVQLTVKAEDGTTNVYTIIFNATYSSDVTIEGILLDGTLIDGFDVNTLSYDVVLPFGTDVLPDITVVSGAEGQSVELTNNGLRGTSTIVITAEDGTTDKTYEIHFSVEASNIAWLQDINADGVWNTEFNPLVTDYHIDLPIGTVALPEVTYTKGDELQTVTEQWNGNELTYTVVAENGVDQMVYTLSFEFLKSHNAYLSDILTNGGSVSGFVPTTMNYTVQVPVGVKVLPEIEPIVGDQWQHITLDTLAIGKDTLVSIVVLADDGVTTNTYEVTFEFLLSGNATLQDINLNGSLMGGFNPETFEYTNMLPIGTTELPEITYEKGDEWQKVTVTDNTTAAEGAYRIEVVAEDGTTNTYVLNFVVEKSHNKQLGSLSVNDYEVELFDDQTNYQVVLPYGTTDVTVTATAAELVQTVDPESQNMATDETATIVVTAQDGTSRTYTVTFSVEKSHNAQLEMIYYDGVAVTDFDPTDEGPYDIALPFGTQTEPVITYDAMPDIFGNDCPYASVNITLLSSSNNERGTLATCDYEVQVVAQDGIEVSAYTLHFEVEKSPENRLRDLTVFGQTVTGFDSETLSYLLQYEPYTDPATLPQNAADFGWTLYDEEFSTAELDIKTDENGNNIGVYNIKVTAENGSVRTYSIVTEIKLSDNTKLNNITVNGKALDNFDPETREYIYIVPFGTVALDSTYVFGWELQETGQTVDPDQNVLIGLTYTIWVEAQDGSFDSYVINFIPDDFDPTQVPTEENVCVSATGDGGWKFTTNTKNVQLVLADMAGQIILIADLDLVDPNIDDICSRQANGFVYNGPSGQVVLYYFLYNGKKVIASGKFRTGN